MIKLIIMGSITEDIIITPVDGEKRFIGGVPIYAASTAKALGEKVGIISKVGTDFQLKNLKILNSLDADLSGFKITGKSSMRFVNEYTLLGKRTQKILSKSEEIRFEDIPQAYYHLPCIHLGPVFNEINPKLFVQLKKIFSLVSLDGQGFTRTTDSDGEKIILKPWENYEDFLPQIDILKVDDTELKGITNTTRLNDAIRLVLATGLKTLVITRAEKGAIIYQNRLRYDIPAVPTEVVDATGAGDTFITAFLLEMQKTNDCMRSGLIAASAASLKIAQSGPGPRYTRKDVIEKLKNFLPSFNGE